MQTAPSRIELPAFPGGKRIAVTTSWDDGRVYDRWVVEKLNAWGMKGTFNLNSGLLARTGTPPTIESGGYLDACEVAALYVGHEVAIHTVTHPYLEYLDPTQIATEVLDDRKALEDLVGYPVRGMAYPFGTYAPQVLDVLRGLGIAYSRLASAVGPTSFPPTDSLVWAPTMYHLAGNPTVSQRWDEYYNSPYSRGVFYVWGHSYEFAEKGPQAIDALLQPLAGKPDVWYCTNIELWDYEMARQRIVLAANKRSAYNPSAIPVTLNVDGTLLEVGAGQLLPLS